MKMFKKILFSFCSILFVSLLFSSMSYAEDKEGIGFEVRPILPSNQIDKTLGYYYLQTEPSVKTNFDLSVYNTREDPITIEVYVENAISSTHGNINYTTDLKLLHSSLKNPTSEIIKPKSNEYTIKGQTEEIINFEVSPPAESYAGAKMGRIIIKEKDAKDEKGILQKYQYAIGLITSESGDPFNDGDKLDLESAKASVYNGSKVMMGHIVNPTPKTIENLKVTSYITKKGSSKKIKERSVENFSFAPNSMVDYQIPWGLSNFETGEYTFHFLANNEFESFKLEKDFKVRGEDAKKLNNEAAFSVGTPSLVKIILVGMNILLILLFIGILFRNKKWIQEIKAKKKGKKNGKKRKKR